MSESYRERLRRRLDIIIKKYNLQPNDLDWVEDHIEELCREADIRCKRIDRIKAVDQVIDELDDEAFDKFAKGVLDEVKARLEKSQKFQTKKKKKKIPDEDYTLINQYSYPVENEVTQRVSENNKSQEITA